MPAASHLCGVFNVGVTGVCHNLEAISGIEFRNSLVPARNACPIATATTKCDLMRSAPSKETKPS
jgi:hypothetical protein